MLKENLKMLTLYSLNGKKSPNGMKIGAKPS
jgi:hypothetical protein